MSTDWKLLFQTVFDFSETLRGEQIDRFFVERGDAGAERFVDGWRRMRERRFVS